MRPSSPFVRPTPTPEVHALRGPDVCKIPDRVFQTPECLESHSANRLPATSMRARLGRMKAAEKWMPDHRIVELVQTVAVSSHIPRRRSPQGRYTDAQHTAMLPQLIYRCLWPGGRAASSCWTRRSSLSGCCGTSMKPLWIGSLVVCAWMAGCSTLRPHRDAQLECDRSIAFAIALWDSASRNWSEVSWRFPRLSEQGHPLRHQYQVNYYLLNCSPRADIYKGHGEEIERAVADGAKRVRQFVPGAISSHIVIDRRRKWNEHTVDRSGTPTSAVFGPVYRIEALGEMITTIRFIVEDSDIRAYEWIAIHKMDAEGRWKIVEMANVTSHKSWTIYADK